MNFVVWSVSVNWVDWDISTDFLSVLGCVSVPVIIGVSGTWVFFNGSMYANQKGLQKLWTLHSYKHYPRIL